MNAGFSESETNFMRRKRLRSNVTLAVVSTLVDGIFLPVLVSLFARIKVSYETQTLYLKPVLVFELALVLVIIGILYSGIPNIAYAILRSMVRRYVDHKHFTWLLLNILYGIVSATFLTTLIFVFEPLLGTPLFDLKTDSLLAVFILIYQTTKYILTSKIVAR